jgi:adhesin transport system membrane fusion protein
VNPSPFAKSRLMPSMTTLLLIGLVSFLLWASFFEIDQSVRAQGQLIPGVRTQIIQAADGGVLSEILVQEGQTVVAGERLAVLERDRPHAAFEESRAKDVALRAALVRAHAEASNQSPQFGAKFKAFPEFVEAQQALYMQRIRGLQEELATLQDGLRMAQEELAMNETLFKAGDTSRLDVMRSQRQVSELQGKSNAVRHKYSQEARLEVSKLTEELSSSRYKLEERQSILGHTVLTAPVAGIVKYLKVTTIGGVLRAGDELMQISPTGGELFIEVKLNPVDIGQLKPGLPVSIKFDAFDYAIYGSRQGTLSYISSDTLTEQGSNGQAITYYRAHVRMAPGSDALGGSGTRQRERANIPLKPGMSASVDIRTDSRSILRYLAKPIFKAFVGAMNER